MQLLSLFVIFVVEVFVFAVLPVFGNRQPATERNATTSLIICASLIRNLRATPFILLLFQKQITRNSAGGNSMTLVAMWFCASVKKLKKKSKEL